MRHQHPRSQIYARPHTNQSRNCAGRRSSSWARLAQHPQSLALSLSCVLRPSPPHYATLKASPKFPKIPTPVLLFSSFCIRTGPCNLWHLPTAPPKPCQFDVPGVAPSTSPILPERPSSVAAEDDNCAHHQTPEGRGCDSARSAQRVAVRACVVATALAESGASRGLSSHPDSLLQGAQPPTTPPKQLERHHISTPFCSIGIIAFE